MTKTMLGSPIYMAPEILRGEIYSTKADIWSLGVVLYEMLYGFCPFESTTIPKLIEAPVGVGNTFGLGHPRRNSAQINQNETPHYDEGNVGSTPNLKRLILKEHGEATRGLHIAVDLIKSNDTNSVLFAYLILRKAEQKLVGIRDEIGSIPETKDLVICFNSELKEISIELSKYNLN
ncbi:unnamed protein product [Sphagnum balticum]